MQDLDKFSFLPFSLPLTLHSLSPSILSSTHPLTHFIMLFSSWVGVGVPKCPMRPPTNSPIAAANAAVTTVCDTIWNESSATPHDEASKHTYVQYTSLSQVPQNTPTPPSAKCRGGHDGAALSSRFYCIQKQIHQVYIHR